MCTFLVVLIGVCLVWGAIDIATSAYRELIRENRRRHRWPREQHPSFFRDLKSAHFPEDSNGRNR